MTAKEKLLEAAPGWSEHDAEVALRAVELEHAAGAGRVEDEWGDLTAFSAQASAATLRRLDSQEAAEGFSWEDRRQS